MFGGSANNNDVPGPSNVISGGTSFGNGQLTGQPTPTLKVPLQSIGVDVPPQVLKVSGGSREMETVQDDIIRDIRDLAPSTATAAEAAAACSVSSERFAWHGDII